MCVRAFACAFMFMLDPHVTYISLSQTHTATKLSWINKPPECWLSFPHSRSVHRACVASEKSIKTFFFLSFLVSESIDLDTTIFSD